MVLPSKRLEDPAAVLATARDKRRDGGHVEAIELLQPLLAARPGFIAAWIELGEALRDAAQFQPAIEAFGRALALDPSRVPAQFGLGRALRQAGQVEAALAPLQQALVQQPRLFPAQLELAEALRDLGRLPEAEVAFRTALALKPNDAEALQGLGRVLHRAGQLNAAVEAMAAAVAARPERVPLRLDLAEWLREAGQPAAAEAALQEVLRRQPRSFRAMQGLGLLARDRADTAAARDWFARAAEANPAAARPVLDLVALLRDAGELDAARQHLTALLARQPELPAAWHALGHLERQAERRAAALEAFQRMAELQPQRAQPLLDAALEARALGRTEAAQADLRRAMALEPSSSAPHHHLAELERMAGRLDAALPLYEAALQLDAGFLPAGLARAWAIATLGDFAGGMQALAALEAAAGPAAEIAARRVDMLRNHGEVAAAQAEQQRAAQLWPDHWGLWSLGAMLAVQQGEATALDALLAAAPKAVRPQDQARVLHQRAHQAAETWALAEAAALYDQALALQPADANMLNEQARVQLLLLNLPAVRQHLRATMQRPGNAALPTGRSTNISTTLLGQVLDEFALDQPALEGLRAAQALPPAARLPALLNQVRTLPDHTPTAMALLLALRQAGLLHPAPAAAGPAIPRRVLQYWDSPEPPPDLEDYLASWPALHPGWTYRRFDDAAARRWLAARCSPPVLQAYALAREPAQKADLFRLAVLYAEGGWYADADDRALAPLDSLAPEGTRLVLYQEHFGTLGNNLIGAAPGEPLLLRALTEGVKAVLRRDSDMVWLATGPGLLTRALAMELAAAPDPRAWLQGRAILTQQQVHRAVARHCSTAYKREGGWLQAEFRARRAKAAIPPAGA